MTLRRDTVSGIYSADIRDRSVGRVHLSLRTKRKDEAMTRHAALVDFVRDGDPSLINDLRQRRINIEAVVRCVRDKLPFRSLYTVDPWPTVETAIAHYITALQLRPDRSVHTARVAKGQLQKFAAHLDLTLPVDRITSQMVTEAATGIRRDGLSAWTTALVVGRLGGLYRWLQRREATAALEAKREARLLHIPVPSELVAEVAVPRVRFLSRDEADRLLAATPDQLWFPVLMGLTCGLRVGEVITLRRPPIDLDLTHGLVTVQTKQVRPGVMWRPKNRERRDVPLTAPVIEAAQIHHDRYARGSWMVPGGTTRDVPISTATMYNAFARIVTDAGLDTPPRDPHHVSFHTLRHTFASWLVMDGVDLFTVSRLMGHKSIKEVEKTYGHLSPDHKRRAVSLFGTWLTTPADAAHQ